MSKIIISPSLLAADFNNLSKELNRMKDAGISYLHFDVMDGHFVPNISFGIPVLKSIGRTYGFKNDVHLMIDDPKKYYKQFIDAGADILCYHYEAMNSVEELLELAKLIHKEGCMVGISIKPRTPASVLDGIIEHIDQVLVMSVEPGFGGQKFNESALSKVKEVREMAQKHNSKLLISIDGGINNETGPRAVEAGANMLVSGSYLFKSENVKEAIESLCRSLS